MNIATNKNTTLLAFTIGLKLILPMTCLAQPGDMHGGGGELALRAVGTESITKALLSSKDVLKDYFLGNESDRHFPFPEVFRHQPSILKMLDSVKIEERKHQPCRTENGTPVDGSIYASKKGSICISSYRLGRSLVSENAHSQTLALVAHEFGHLAGMDESHAQALQTYVLAELGRGLWEPNLVEFPKPDAPTLPIKGNCEYFGAGMIIGTSDFLHKMGIALKDEMGRLGWTLNTIEKPASASEVWTRTFLTSIQGLGLKKNGSGGYEEKLRIEKTTIALLKMPNNKIFHSRAFSYVEYSSRSYTMDGDVQNEEFHTENKDGLIYTVRHALSTLPSCEKGPISNY